LYSVFVMCLFIFFFSSRRRHTRFKCDWSSDVCSSDLAPCNYRDFFPYIRSSWIWMEMGTVLAALFALRKVRFPFLVAPLSVALWFMSMDIAAYLGGHETWEFDLARKVSFGFGLGMLLVAYVTDQRTRQDFAFWLYLFG